MICAQVRVFFAGMRGFYASGRRARWIGDVYNKKENVLEKGRFLF